MVNGAWMAHAEEPIVTRHRIRDSLSTPDLRGAFDYWVSVRGDHRLPSRADIRPEDVTGLLPKLFLLAGTGLRSVYGVEPTHRPVHSLFHPAIADRLVAGYWDVLDHHKIEYLELTLYPPSTAINEAAGPVAAQYSYRRLLMPLASDHQTADMLLGCVNVVSCSNSPSRRHPLPTMGEEWGESWYLAKA